MKRSRTSKPSMLTYWAHEDINDLNTFDDRTLSSLVNLTDPADDVSDVVRSLGRWQDRAFKLAD